MRSEGRQSQSIGVLATVMALVMGLAFVGGCASGDDAGATASGSDEPYPNLGDVPERPATMTEEQREQLEQGLVADSQQREYSEEVIAFQAEPAEPLPAPMETGAGDEAASSLGHVAMPGAVTPPFSGSPGAPSTPTAPVASTVATAAAAAQASASTIPVPPEDPLARATTPPFSGSTVSVPAPVVPQPAVPQPAVAAYTPPAASYTPVPNAPTALAGDSSTSDLNRAQLDSLRPSPPPFSGTTGATPGSYAPPPVTPAYTASAATPAYMAPPATPAYTPSPADVRQVFEARLRDSLPATPVAPLPASDSLGGGEPLTTVVVSSRGVATFEELPVNIPELQREPVPASVGGRRGSLARAAVPGGSVKVATILFTDGSSSLRDREREIVRKVYERYLASGRKVRVVGHSSSRTRNMDPIRHRMVNFGISAERANAVALELQRLGVPSDQITVVAAADDMPMYYEVMPSGEAGNRRTEIYLD